MTRTGRDHAVSVERTLSGSPEVVFGLLCDTNRWDRLVGVSSSTYTYDLLDPDDPSRCLYSAHRPLIEANPDLTRSLEDKMYLRDVVFTTGIADAGDYFIVASGEADLACRITHIPKSHFGL